jgi:hypothetical protein
VSEPQPEVCDAVIDLATQKYPLELTPPERDLLATITPAEQNLADRITQERAATARRVMTAAYQDPEPAAHEIHFLNDGPDPDMSLYEGLPVTAPEMHCLFLTQPWPALETTRARQISSAWTLAERTLFTERIGPLITGGVNHWPD